MSNTRWKPGQSGNPRGRSPNSGEVGKLRTSIAAHVPEIIERLTLAAKGGDVGAARLLLERVLPPIKATEQGARIEMPEGSTLVDQGRAVLAAAASGELAPSQAAQLLVGLGAVARLVESEELAARLDALEARAKAQQR